MRAFLIGHRGTGKSTFLKKLSLKFPDVPAYDLDLCIAEGENESIIDIFKFQGEVEFRNLERRYFEKILENHPSPSPLLLSLGAGFDTSLLQKSETYWIGRRSDMTGRIFLNRPALTKTLTHPREALFDYFSRFEMRQKAFTFSAGKNIAWFTEGGFLKEDMQVFFNDYNLQGASLTLTPDVLELCLESRKRYFEKLKRINLGWLELRTDLFTTAQLESLISETQGLKILLSVRNAAKLPHLSAHVDIDWDLQFKLPENQALRDAIKFLSSHSSDAPLSLDLPKAQLKWAPEVSSWKDVEKGLKWQSENQSTKNFLPRSAATATEPQFVWLRLYLKGRQQLNFVKERSYSKSEESLLKNFDQPLITEWLQWDLSFKNFAAVIGDPVLHSWSPTFHSEFFKKAKYNFVAIPVSKDELKGSLDLLIKLGLRAAAVTSPLKQSFFNINANRHISAQVYEAANTLAIHDDGQIKIWNTDILGAEFLFRGLEGVPCAVVGGGGTQDILKASLPRATCYSARTKEKTSGPEQGSYKIVVWAAGGKVEDLPDEFLPPSTLNPKVFVDLDYREDSTGRAIALYLKKQLAPQKLKYIPGDKMFVKQAQGQQQIWRDFLGL